MRDFVPVRPTCRPPATRRRARAASACLFCLLLSGGGCRTSEPVEETGKLYRHNWWNYYARGSAFLKQGKTVDAQADFQRCLGLLSGATFRNDHDMWRARTYGLHFVEGYFPNRELGICLYERNDFAQAIHFLERSLSQEPSGRAKHYLNLAFQKQMSGQAVPPPLLRLNRDSEIAFTGDRTCLVDGTASGEGRIRRLSVAGRPEFIELATGSLPFSRHVALHAGTNRVSIEAEDLLGQRTTRHVVRIADWQPPSLQIRRVTAENSALRIEGSCRDSYGLDVVALDGVPLFRCTGNARHVTREIPISFRVPLTGGTFTATDLAGNRLQSPLSAAVLAQMAEPENVRHRLVSREPVFPQTADMVYPVQRVLSACAVPDLQNASVVSRMEAHARAFQRLSRAAPLRVLAADNTVASDRLRPSLSLRGCQPLTRVFSEDFYVDGTAADGGGLASVAINGENLLGAGDEGTLRTYFARRLPLDPGTNRFEIVATDHSGNRTAEHLTVVRLRPEYLDEALRLSVGVPPLTPAEAGPIGVRVKRSMETELTRSPVRFRLLERDEGWDFVLREQGLSVSDLADPSAALRIGKMVPAEMLLMGKIFNEAKGLTVYLKVVETGNGAVVFASDVYSPDPDFSLDDAVAGLVLKVQQGFPLVTGEVLRRQGSLVTLNVGRQEGATENSRFVVINATAAENLAEGQVCKKEGKAIQLQIERVQQNTSSARIVPSAADAIVKEGYYVYTR